MTRLESMTSLEVGSFILLYHDISILLKVVYLLIICTTMIKYREAMYYRVI